MAQGQLSRDEMEAIIRRGESVLHRGKFIYSLNDLPSIEELAAPEERSSVMDELLRQQRELSERISALSSQMSVQSSTPAGAGAGSSPASEPPAASSGAPPVTPPSAPAPSPPSPPSAPAK